MDEEEKRQELRRLFLTLWDKAVGTPTYNKQEWKQLDALISPLLYAPRVPMRSERVPKNTGTIRITLEADIETIEEVVEAKKATGA